VELLTTSGSSNFLQLGHNGQTLCSAPESVCSKTARIEVNMRNLKTRHGEKDVVVDWRILLDTEFMKVASHSAICKLDRPVCVLDRSVCELWPVHKLVSSSRTRQKFHKLVYPVRK
jgi:hypothetical protein